VLTLTRKLGEAICIGDDIKIIVKEIRGRQIRLGIIAPRDIYVCREELYKKIQEENLKALAPDSNSLEAISDLFAPQEEG